MSKRRVKAVLCVAMLAAQLAVSPAQAADKPKVALIMKSLANEFFLTMETGAKDYQKQNAGKFDLIANGIKDETDTANQIRIVEQMVASKANAIVIAPADSKALVPAIKRAVDAGVIVINIDNKFDDGALKERGSMSPLSDPTTGSAQNWWATTLPSNSRRATRWPSSKAYRRPSTPSSGPRDSRTPCRRLVPRSSACNPANGKWKRPTRSLLQS